MLNKRKVIILNIVLLLIMTKIVMADISSQVQVVNIPPQLVSNIPDQQWASNTNLINAFDLDDYFVNGLEMNYSSSSLSNITVVIDSTTHEVSFYPDQNFTGTQTVIFTADNGEYTTQSNVVNLTVGIDTQPPRWSSPDYNPKTVYQNKIVTLSAKWTDDTALKQYILTVNQDGNWLNQSIVTFSGRSNESDYAIQIKSVAGTVVYWYITAFDTSGNYNSTSIQNFTISSLPTPTPSTSPTPSNVGSSSSSSSSGETATASTVPKKKDSFIVEPDTGFILNMLKGERKTVSFKITNTGELKSHFDISIIDLGGFQTTTSKNNFTILQGNSTVVSIDIISYEESLPDIYSGYIRINSTTQINIPIIIALNELRTNLELNVSVINKTQFLPLDKVRANIEIRNLRDILKRDIYMYYAIMNFNGEIINSGTDQFSFEAQKTSMQKELELSKSIPRGTYVFFARAITNGSVAIGVDSIEVGEKKNLSSYFVDNLWLILLVVIVVIAIIISLVEYRDRRRLKLLNLYIMVNELRKAMKEENYPEALKIFVKLKREYDEPVADSLLNNKEQLYIEMKKFVENTNAKIESSSVAILKNAEEENAKKAAVAQSAQVTPDSTVSTASTVNATTPNSETPTQTTPDSEVDTTKTNEEDKKEGRKDKQKIKNKPKQKEKKVKKSVKINKKAGKK